MQTAEMESKVDTPAWLTAAEVARLAGRDVRVIRKLAADGVLPAHRPGRCRPMFARSDVDKFLGRARESMN